MAPDEDPIKTRLLERQRELLEQSTENADSRDVVTLDQTSVGGLSRMDAMQGQAMALAQQQRRVLELQRIASALQRLQDGDYGFCVSCGEVIAEQRLQFDPAATQCIDCAQRQTKKR